MLLESRPSVVTSKEDTTEGEDINLILRRLVAPYLGLKPEEITPADIQQFRTEHIYPTMKLDIRNEHGGFIHQNEHCFTEREIQTLREETDKFFASLEH
jgi:hypothetical protein